MRASWNGFCEHEGLYIDLSSSFRWCYTGENAAAIGANKCIRMTHWGAAIKMFMIKRPVTTNKTHLRRSHIYRILYDVSYVDTRLNIYVVGMNCFEFSRPFFFLR